MIIPHLTGFDPLEALLKQLSGELDHVNYDDYRNKFAVLKFFDLPRGKVKSIYIDDICFDNVLAFNINIKPGQVIKNPQNSNERTGYFIVHGNSIQETQMLEKTVEESVHLEML